MSDWIEVLPSAWKGHRAFAEWLVLYRRPEIIVELGVDYGYSTFCFAQSLNRNNKGKIYGIDLFLGDKHTSFRNNHDFVVNQMKAHHLNRIELIVKDFNEAAKEWNQPIDILHIDGLHTYEAIRNDFENWSKYVKKDGIILLHDVCIYHSDFGVYKFFDEIDWPKMYFEHSAGLGIVSKNIELLNVIQETFPDCKFKPKMPKTKDKQKNLFLIISVLYPCAVPLSYVPLRTIYSPSERYEQTKNTIKSIREKAPGSYIYLAEGSQLPIEIESELKTLVDKYENFSHDEIIKKCVDDPQKGRGEITLILNSLNKLDNSNDFDNYFKISGRYYLDDHFDLNYLMTASNIFSLCGDRYATTMYKIYKTNLQTYMEALRNSLKDIDESMEVALYKAYPPNHPDNSITGRIGVSGLVGAYHNCFISN